MEQDVISTSWKDLPWQKFQKKSFRLQCEIYKAKQNNKPRLVRRLQKLLIKSKSVHYLAVRRISEVFRNKGLFLSGDKKFSLVEESYYGIGNRRHTPFKSFSTGKNSREFFNMSFLRNKVIEYVWKFTIEPTCLNKGIDFNRFSKEDFGKVFLVSMFWGLARLTASERIIFVKDEKFCATQK
jgi:hypothetical protein